jgi:hypothetical protein
MATQQGARLRVMDFFALRRRVLSGLRARVCVHLYGRKYKHSFLAS